MQDSDVGDSTLQLVIDQLEELVVTVVEEVRERPGIALALVAGVVGAVVGSWLARRKRAAAPVRAAQGRARSAGDTVSLLGTAMRTLQNPLVRALIVAAIERQVKRRLSV